LFLFLLSIVPEFKLYQWKFKKIDLLADLRDKSIQTHDSIFNKTNSFISDTLQTKIDSIAKVSQLKCPPGITCIEDYSKDSTALQNFIEALNQIQTKHKVLRIAMCGDSFIEGDVLCGSLRDTLQSLFGGNGVGYVPIASEVAGFRRNIKHKFEHWETHSLINRKDSTIEAGPVGFTFIPQPGNWVEYKPVKNNNIREFNAIRFYYKNFGTATLEYTLNDTITLSEDIKTSSSLQEWKYYERHINSIKITFPYFDSLYLYGASFENTSGIYVDNFSMRGNSGIALHKISDKMLSSFNKFRNYKLIILQYGLNSIREDSLNYEGYALRMIKVVNKLKKNYPKASILLISVSDRATNTNGVFETMKAIPAMRNAQRYIAQETGIAFWDMYEAMGGENSMIKFVTAKPPLAAKDYTHLTFKGGRKLAGLLTKSLLHEQVRYENKDK
jgi:lysophospholipase L1-like esterase